MGHPQPETSMQVYNWNYDGIINRKIQKFSKAMDTRFHSVIDRFKKKPFDVFWNLGVRNLGYYFTNHQLLAYHKGIIPVYLQCPNKVQDSTRVCYSRYNSNSTQGKPRPAGGYNSTESQYKVCTKYIPSEVGVQTKPRMRYPHTTDNKAKPRCTKLLEF